jgi:hypothetical protein
MAGRLVPSPIPGTSLESACGRVSTDSARSSSTRASRRLEPLSPPRDCRGQLSGLSGRRSQATRPWRHRQLQTAANSMCPEAWPIFRARHDTVICEMWPVCCPTWESSPRAQSTRGGITTEVALYIVDRGSRWSVVRSVVTNAGYHGNRAGESLQNLVTLARGRCSSSFENNGCEIPCVFAPQSFPAEGVRRSKHAAEARKIGTSLLFGTGILLVLSGVLRLSAPLMLVRQYRSGN